MSITASSASASITDTFEKFHFSRYKHKIIVTLSLLCIAINILSWQDTHNDVSKATLLLRRVTVGNSAGDGDIRTTNSKRVTGNPRQHLPYETMIPPSLIDYDVDHRLSWNNNDRNNNHNNNDHHDVDDEDPCREILLTLPDEIRQSGQGAQLNHYLLSAVMATYLNKALVVAENPHYEYESGRPSKDLYDGGSQFGCPVDAFEDGDGRTTLREDFPLGLSRLIQVPRWVSRGCPVPTCGGTMSYDDWRAARSTTIQEIPCVEEDGRESAVTVFSVDGRGPYLEMFRTQMVDRSTKTGIRRAQEWAMRLGATPEEARSFSQLTSYYDIYDYAAARINESGLIRFQPWIARDVQRRIESLSLPSSSEGYDSMHIRRGDKLIMEAAEDVRSFWRSKGYGEGEDVPSNYVPFWHYVEMAWGACEESRHGGDDGDAMARREKSPRFVYIATDDPETVRQEVESLPQSTDGARVANKCHDTAQFVFAPSSKDTRFHLKDGGSADDCHSVYERNIAALADLFVLARSDKFVGDYNSNWGRIIRIFRLFLNHDRPSEDGGSKPMTTMKDMVVAWGHGHPEPGL
eukprot:CCRYP_003173-RA/>CCRYP_003173-RA protein AED:0.06 eAED:0.06 QI:285/1/1/1/1/1/2/104/575